MLRKEMGINGAAGDRRGGRKVLIAHFQQYLPSDKGKALAQLQPFWMVFSIKQEWVITCCWIESFSISLFMLRFHPDGRLLGMPNGATSRRRAVGR